MQQPDAILCYSAVDIIEAWGDLIFTEDSRLPGTERPRDSERFAEAVDRNAIRLMVELVGPLDRRVLGLARMGKQRLFGLT